MPPAISSYVPRLVLDWEQEAPGSECRQIDGALVFVDITGFTAMSERMAKKGKVGAEEVTDVLSVTFAELLDVAYKVGGNLLKFGGDALLLFFRGDEHVGRACHAAGSMRAALLGKGPIDTSAGKIRLDMSIGIHSGPFYFFLVGDSHKELIIASPESSITVEMESAAGPGEVLLSSATASKMSETHLGPQRNGGRPLIASCPAPQQVETTMVPENPAAERFLPHAIRDHILGGGEEAEHRQVTIGFIHFGGTDELIRNSQVDDVTARLRELITHIQSVVKENEICFLGTDIDRDGGKIILTAGAPQATANDEERMLRTLRALCDRATCLQLRIGVHRGHVFAGAVGPSYRRTYTVMGDAVNTAARLMTRAAPGQILATRDVLDRSVSLFEVEELEPFEVKGKTKKLQAFSVGALKGRRMESQLIDLPLIGRLDELNLLRSALDSAKRGEGKVVEIVGEAGIGKTRLTRELLGVDEEFLQVIVQCEQYESLTAYYPIRALLLAALGAEDDSELELKLRAAVEAKVPELVDWLPLLGIPLNLDLPSTPKVDQLDERFRAARLRASVISLVEALLPSPTLLLFEDAHWMDDASRDLLADLVKEAGERSWAIFVTTRPDHLALEAGPAGIRLELEPLSKEDAYALARAASSDSLLPQQAEVVARRGGGNPLFVQALVAAARHATDLSQLPETIESAISARIDELRPADRTLLRRMAVLGREIDLDLLPEVIEKALYGPEILARLSEFLYVEGSKAMFRQALIRDAAYEGLSYRLRRNIHEKIARLIEIRSLDPTKEAEILAVHFDKAQCHEESWHYSRIAVGQAWRKFAPSNAIHFSRKAIVAGKSLRKPKAEMALMWRELGFASFRVGQYEEAFRAFAKIRNLTNDIGLIGWLFLMQGQCKESLGNQTQALRWYGRGLKFLESRAPLGKAREPFTSPPSAYDPISPRVRLIESQATVRRQQGLPRKAVELSHQAVAVAVAVSDHRGLAIAYNLLQIAYTDLRDPARRKYGEMALALADEVGNVRLRATILNNLAVDAYWEGEWHRSLSLYEASKESFIAAGDVIWSAAVINNIAEILSDQGRFAEAEAQFRECLSTFRAAHFELHVATVTANLGRIAARAGDFKRAERQLAEAIDSLKQMGYPSLEPEVRLAEVKIFDGDPLAAFEALDRIVPGNDPILRSTIHRIRGWALAQFGKQDEAEESFATSLQLARSAGADYEIGLTLDALVRTARSEEPRPEHLEEKEQIFQRLGIVSEPEVPLPESPPSGLL